MVTKTVSAVSDNNRKRAAEPGVESMSASNHKRAHVDNVKAGQNADKGASEDGKPR